MTGSETRVEPANWAERIGWFPGLAVLMAIGLLIVSVAFNAARDEQSWASIAYWIGLIIVVGAPAARMLQPGVDRTERLAVVIALGLALYWTSVLRSPSNLTGYDDLLNFRTLLDVLSSGHLFTENPLLLVNGLYPSLPATTTAFSQVSGMDPFLTTVVIMGLLRVILVLATFLLFETISGSSWIGGVAALLYMTNPDFLFFNASYVYESFALPFAVVTLWLIAERQSAVGRTYRGLTVVALLAVAAVVMGHHLTTAALAAALVIWSGAVTYRRWRGQQLGRTQDVSGMAAITIIGAVAWSLYFATEMIKYVGSLTLATLGGAIGFLTGSGPGRELFKAAGSTTPPEERLVALAAILIVVVTLPIGLVILWRTLRTRPAALLLGVVALGYPASQVLRLTSSGGLEVASRANSFVFIGVAFTMALVAVAVIGRLGRAPRAVVQPVATALVVVMFGGAVVLGSTWWSRLPGPFIVGGESRAISPQGAAAASWMLAELGPDNRVAADRTNRLLVGADGRQRVVFDARDVVELWPLYADPTFDGPAIFALRSQDIRYVLVDRRLSTAIPRIGLYFDQSELQQPHTTPIAAAGLDKFDADARVDRIYDSGAIRIYETQAILDE